MPTSTPTLIKEGAFDADNRNILNNSLCQQLVMNTTVVSNTNPTSATTMMTATLPNSVLNAVGKGFELFATGTYSLGATSTVVITVTLGGVTIGTFTSSSNTNTSVTSNWQLWMTGATVTTGGSGTMEIHGELNIDLGAALSAASTCFLDSNTAVLTAMPLNSAMVLNIQGNVGTGNAASVVAERFLSVTLTN